MLQTLGSGSSDDGGNGSPLGGHQLGQMEQLLFLLSGPFCLFDARVKPLVPIHKDQCMTSEMQHPGHPLLLIRSLTGAVTLQANIAMTHDNLNVADFHRITYHLALHCLADFLCRSDAIRDHWFLPYFITAAFRISSYKYRQRGYVERGN